MSSEASNPSPSRRSGVRRLVPYRVRLWWATRSMPVCSCENPARAPWLHDRDCPVWVPQNDIDARRYR